MTYNLYLDDLRELPFKEGNWRVARSYEEFVDVISTWGLPDKISFDHDLADAHYPWNDPSYATGTLNYASYKEKTGYDCAKWLVDFCVEGDYKLPSILIHTQNPIGYKNISTYLDNARKHLGL